MGLLDDMFGDGTQDDDNPSAGAPTQAPGEVVTAGAPAGFQPEGLGLFGGNGSLQAFSAGLLATPKHAGFAAALANGQMEGMKEKGQEQDYIAQQLRDYIAQQTAPQAIQTSKNNLALQNAGLAQYGIDPTTGQPFAPSAGGINAPSAPGMVGPAGNAGAPAANPWARFAGMNGAAGGPVTAAQLIARGQMLSQRPDPQSQRAGAQLTEAGIAMMKNGLTAMPDGTTVNTPGSLAAGYYQKLNDAKAGAHYGTVNATVNGVDGPVPADQFPGIYNAGNGPGPVVPPPAGGGGGPLPAPAPANTAPPAAAGGGPVPNVNPVSNASLQALLGGANVGPGGQVMPPAEAQAAGAALNAPQPPVGPPAAPAGAGGPTAMPQAGPPVATGAGMPAVGKPYMTPEGQEMSKGAGEETLNAGKAAAAAAQTQAGIRAALGNIEQFTPGKTAPLKATLAAYGESIGIDPKDLDKAFGNVDDAQALTKQFLTIAANRTRQLGAREPGFVLQTFQKGSPNLELTPNADKLLLNVMDQDAQRTQDYAQFRQNMFRTAGSAIGAETAFDQANPSEKYIVNAYQNAGMPVRLPTAPTLGKAIIAQMAPGQQALTPKGQIYTKPAGR